MCTGCSERQYRDAREVPIVYGGYSISWNNRTSVRMSPRAYKELKGHFLCMATRERQHVLEREFQQAPFEPYAGITRQMFAIHRAVNRARRTAGLSIVPRDCIRVRRRVVRPFDEQPNSRDNLANYEFPLAA
jgi:hypothetical protein